MCRRCQEKVVNYVLAIALGLIFIGMYVGVIWKTYQYDRKIQQHIESQKVRSK